MILQKSFKYADLVLKNICVINIETVVLPNIFVETKDSLMNIKLKRIFLNICNVITVTIKCLYNIYI